MHVVVLVFGALCLHASQIVSSSKTPQGPAFVQEPAGHVQFTNSTGISISCSARGNPNPGIRWQTAEGHSVFNVPGLREIRSDGTLVFLPFRPQQYRQDVHTSIYRCLAANRIGTVRSRDVSIRAVVLQRYELRVYDQFVPRGNTAVLRCHVPTVVKEFIKIVLWLRDDGVSIGPTGISSDKYTVLKSGELLIRNTSPTDAFRGYKCQGQHILNNELTSSTTSGQLIVTEPHNPLSPKVIESKPTYRSNEGDSALLVCVGQGVPQPQTQWYRKVGNRLRSLSTDHRVYQNYELLIFRKVVLQDSGVYVCVVNNSAGREEVTSELIVTAPLSARILPITQSADVGRTASFTCRNSGHPITSLVWYKDGRPMTFNSRVTSITRDSLQIAPVQRSDRGMYQCLLFNGYDSAQSAAELSIGEDVPVFVHTFQEQKSLPGSSVSMKCSASGKPLPQITWTIDGQPVPEAYHIRIGDYVSSEYTVNSYVNISSVTVEDGGLYACIAQNEVGKEGHTARLNIYGPPHIRMMANVSAMAGTDVAMTCPVAGYPIEKISWERDSRRLPQSHRQHVFPNGTLVLQEVLRAADGGRYTCSAENKESRSASRDVYVNIMIPPALEPFAFPKDLTDGKRAGVACVVSAGDLPIKIQWLKDEKPLPEELEASISSANDFTSFISFARVRQFHNGNYTCVASNPVAAANYTAVMTVHVPPKWRVQPVDKSVVLGESVTLDCQADGFPSPVIRWKRMTDSVQGNFQVIISSANIQIRENGSLTIREVGTDDSGKYMCQATNGVGPGLSTVIHLVVRVAAHFDKKFEAQTIRKGKPLILTCEAKGERPITVTWTKDRHTFTPSMDSRYVLEEDAQEDSVRSLIRIPTADRRDSALFTCLAENAYGKDEITYQVIVQEPPDNPRNPGFLAKTSRSLTITWSHPYSGNSPISNYVIQYSKIPESWEDAKKVTMEGSVNEFILRELIPETTYYIRLFAENPMGISEPSEVLQIETDEEAPNEPVRDVEVSAITSRSLRISWKPPSQNDWHGTIQGYYVGIKINNSNEPFSYKTVESKDSTSQTCELTSLKKFTKYVIVVQPFNGKGAGPTSQEFLGVTLEFDPPPAPKLKLLSSTSASFHIAWDIHDENDNPIGGYILFQKTSDQADFEEISLASERHSYFAQGLPCGKRYQLYVVAFNSAGRGQASEEIVARTEGSAPMAPDKTALLNINSTCVSVTLTSWQSGGCPIKYFVIQYKLREQPDWILFSSNVLMSQKMVVISDLVPASWYALLLIAHNDAGATEAEYVFATRTLSGATVPPLAVGPDTSRELYHHLKIIIPIVCTAVVLVLIVTVACVVLIKRRQQYTNANTYQQEENREAEVSKTVDTVPMTVWEKRPRSEQRIGQSREQLYFPSPYATSRVSMYSEYEVEGGPPQSWKVARAEHTYDVPFLRRQGPPETSEVNAGDNLFERKYLEADKLCLPAVVDLPPERNDFRQPNSDFVASTLESQLCFRIDSLTQLRCQPSRHRSEPRLRYTCRKSPHRYAAEENDGSQSDDEDGLYEDYELSEAECDMHLQMLRLRRDL